MSHFELYIHVVWATYRRQALLHSELEPAVYACILQQVRESGYKALEVNGMADHVHLLIQCGAQIDLSVLMKKVKGVFSAFANDRQGSTGSFRWQEGYYAATVTPSHLPKVRSYIQQQKEHHQKNVLFAVWELT